MGTSEPRGTLELLVVVEDAGRSPEPEVAKENPPEDKENVESDIAGIKVGAEAETNVGIASSLCGACVEVGVLGVLPDDLGCRSPSRESCSGILRRERTPGFWLII